MITWKQSIEIFWSRPVGFRYWCIIIGVIIGLTVHVRYLLLPWLGVMQDEISNSGILSSLLFLLGASIPLLVAITGVSRFLLRQQDVDRIRATVLGQRLADFFLGRISAMATYIGIFVGLAITGIYVNSWWPLTEDWISTSGVVIGAFGLLLASTSHVAAIAACFQGKTSNSDTDQENY